MGSSTPPLYKSSAKEGNKNTQSPSADDASKLRFKPVWPVLVLSVMIFPLLVSLGFWQISRAGEKQQLFEDREARQVMNEIQDLSQLKSETPENIQFRSVVLEGDLQESSVFLLENKVQNGQIGYEVVSIFKTRDGHNILVNRGWVSGGAGGRQIPTIPQARADSQLRGYLHKPSVNSLHQNQKIEQNANTKMIKILSIDVDAISQFLGKPLFPWVLRLDADSPAALNVNWTVANMTPQKHYGYASQWFAMAFVLLVANFFANTNLVRYLKRVKK